MDVLFASKLNSLRGCWHAEEYWAAVGVSLQDGRWGRAVKAFLNSMTFIQSRDGAWRHGRLGGFDLTTPTCPLRRALHLVREASRDTRYRDFLGDARHEAKDIAQEQPTLPYTRRIGSSSPARSTLGPLANNEGSWWAEVTVKRRTLARTRCRFCLEVLARVHALRAGPWQSQIGGTQLGNAPHLLQPDRPHTAQRLGLATGIAGARRLQSRRLQSVVFTTWALRALHFVNALASSRTRSLAGSGSAVFQPLLHCRCPSLPGFLLLKFAESLCPHWSL